MIKKWQAFIFQNIILIMAIVLPFNLHAAERWYSSNQAKAGESVFNTNCAVCHGAAASATPDWRKRLADGRYPPPPLNGTAHAWHHPLIALRRQINKGGQKYGGWMPAFDDSLTDAQVDEVIAYFQSLWSDEIYAGWLKNDLAQSNELPTSDKTVNNVAQNEILRQLSSRLPNSKFGTPEETPLKGIFRLSMDDNIIYVSSDGRYVFLGDMVDLVSGRNITKKGVP